MKVDIDELERAAMFVLQSDNWVEHAKRFAEMCKPSNVLALIARNRELEAACRCAATALRTHDPNSPTAKHTDEILARGVVLP